MEYKQALLEIPLIGSHSIPLLVDRNILSSPLLPTIIKVLFLVQIKSCQYLSEMPSISILSVKPKNLNNLYSSLLLNPLG